MSWKDKGQQLVYRIINPLIELLIKLGITPNMVTFLGLLLNVVASVIFIYGAEHGSRSDHRYVGYGGLAILLGGLMDMVDGRLARVSNKSSKYGALFDSVLDRYSEMIMFLGICYYLVSFKYFYSSLFAFIAMIGSIMVSYTRARSEGLGVSAKGGMMQRPERILIIGISALLCGIVSGMGYGDTKIIVDWLPFPLYETISIFTFPIFILAIFANITAINRLLEAKELLEPKN
ncbi:MAG TPA: CDP-alcohol phosphatidyltransferase family protein [Saprospiraceae bacterium]|nr:CDP-alcohol phosphatidyltransferase family protein [Saprospiraceae bacterium]